MDLRINSCSFTSKRITPKQIQKALNMQKPGNETTRWYVTGIIPKKDLKQEPPVDYFTAIDKRTGTTAKYAKG